MRDADRTQQCIHEAAHAVVGHVLGLDVIGIRLAPDSASTSLMSTMSVPDLSWGEDNPRWWMAWAAHAVAGDVAVDDTFSESDREQADVALTCLGALGVPFTQNDAREMAYDILVRYEREHLHLTAALKLYDEIVMPRMVLLSYLPDLSKEKTPHV